MPMGAQGRPRTDGRGDLLVIGGAEDKLGKRTVLKEFVERAGGPRPASRSCRRLPRWVPRSSTSTPHCSPGSGPSEVYGVRPEDRAQASDPTVVHELDRATGIFMTGGNQLKLSTVIAGTPFGRGDRRGARARRDHRRHLRRGEHPVLPHGRLRTGRVHSQAADDPGGRGARTRRELCDRPALRPAQPLRAAADDRVAEPAAAGHGRRRGHRGRHQPHRRRATSCGSSGRGSVTLFDGTHMVTNAHEAREHRPILASGVVLHVLPAGVRVRPDHATAAAGQTARRPGRGRRIGLSQP